MKRLLFLLAFLVLAGSANAQIAPPQLEVTVSILDLDYLPINLNTKAPDDVCVFGNPVLDGLAQRLCDDHKQL